MIRSLTDLGFFATISDAGLRAALERQTGQPSDEEANRLTAGIERRGFDI